MTWFLQKDGKPPVHQGRGWKRATGVQSSYLSKPIQRGAAANVEGLIGQLSENETSN